MNQIVIADYEPAMLEEMIRLFYDTVHTINSRDYTEGQLVGWAPLIADNMAWQQRLKNNVCKVACTGDVIVGFAELSADGHVDTMYVHKDYQRMQVATRLLEALLSIAQEKKLEIVTTEASITAKPFFEQHGFYVTRVKRKLHNGKPFINYKMTKELR